MSKLRMERRRKLATFSPVFDVHTNVLLGHLGDLTPKGALMASGEPVKAGQTLTVSIEFHENPDTSAFARMNISARAAWCRLEDRGSSYNVGLEFLDVTKQNEQLIREILEKYEISRKTPKGAK